MPRLSICAIVSLLMRLLAGAAVAVRPAQDSKDIDRARRAYELLHRTGGEGSPKHGAFW